MIDALTDFKQGARAMWAAGDYARFAPLVAEVGERLVERAGVRAGRRGARRRLRHGQRRDPRRAGRRPRHGGRPDARALPRRPVARGGAGVEVDWVEGDVEALPFEDDSFDVVLSSFGCMFAPRHAVAAAELARVLRPGGRLGISRVHRLAAPAATSSARSAPTCRPHRRSPRTRSAGATRRTSAPSSPGSSSPSSRALYVERFESLDHAVELYTTTFGPIVALGGAALADELRALFERHATDGGTRVPYEYLVTLSPTGPAAARRA